MSGAGRVAVSPYGAYLHTRGRAGEQIDARPGQIIPVESESAARDACLTWLASFPDGCVCGEIVFDFLPREARPTKLPERLAREALSVIRARAMGDVRDAPTIDVDDEDPDACAITAAIRAALTEAAHVAHRHGWDTGRVQDAEAIAAAIEALKG